MSDTMNTGIATTLIMLAFMLCVTMIQREYTTQMKMWAENGYCETTTVGHTGVVWQKCK